MPRVAVSAVTGGFRSRSCLDKLFAEVGAATGLASDVTRAIRGHATEAMQWHDSTVAADEMRDGLAKLIDIAIVRRLP